MVEAEMRFFSELGLLLGSRVRRTRRLGPQVVYVELEDGRRLVHKEVPRQELGVWRPGAPWAELVWIDFLSSRGLPVPPLVAADVEHGWLVAGYVEGRMYSEGLDVGAFDRLLEALLAIEEACVSAPADVRHFSAERVEADPKKERRAIERWIAGPAQGALDALIAEAFEGAAPRLGPVDIRPENALDRGHACVLIDFAVVGEEYTERRIAGYTWRARPSPKCQLSEEHYRTVERNLGRKAALRLAFFDFVYCAWALGRALAGSEGGRRPGAALESLRMEWTRRRLDDERVEAIGSGLAL